MNFLDLKNISEQYMELINPFSAEKMLLVGQYMRLAEGSRVIDFGCGFGEVLALWAGRFGITGVGIDIRPYACQRATHKMATLGLADRIEIVCGDGAAYTFPAHSFDAAVCTGATFIWNGFEAAARALGRALRPGGRIAIGEVYWLADNVPSEFKSKQPDFYSEAELLQQIRRAGFGLEYMVRASHEDWDRYEAGNWNGLVRWLEHNPTHPERQQVIDHLRSSQEEYLRYIRPYLGWAVYVLGPSLAG